MPPELELMMDATNYTTAQRHALVGAFRRAGFDVEGSEYLRKSLGDLPGYLLIVASFTLLELSKAFVKDAYEAWLKDALHRTFFSPRHKDKTPVLEIQCGDHQAIINSNNVADLAAALEILEEVLSQQGKTSELTRPELWLNYDKGVWTIYPDLLAPNAYRYDATTKSFEQIRR